MTVDDDPQPEVLVTSYLGITLLEHDGTPKYVTAAPVGAGNYAYPATAHDFDGDGKAEFAQGTQAWFRVFEADLTIVWEAQVRDLSGSAGGTAFDFLGDGFPEAIYADEHNFFALSCCVPDSNLFVIAGRSQRLSVR